MRTLTLPASGLKVNYSTKLWRHLEGDPQSVELDLPAPQPFDVLNELLGVERTVSAWQR
jgi:hypothetical protein